MFRRVSTTMTDTASSMQSFTADIVGNLRLDTLQAAYERVIARHPTLIKHASANIEVIEANHEKAEPAYSPCHIRVTRKDTTHYQLTAYFSLKLLDDRSIAIFFSELCNYYNNLNTGLDVPKPVPSIKHIIIPDTAIEERKKYWSSKLDDLTILTLITSQTFERKQSFKSDICPITINSDLAQKLSQHFSHAKPEELLTAALHTLLHRHTSQNDITLGMTISNRQRTHRFIDSVDNTLPIRMTIDANQSFMDFLSEVSHTATEAEQQQLSPDDLLSVLGDDVRKNLHSAYPFEAQVTVCNNLPQLSLKGVQFCTVRENPDQYTDLSLFELKVRKQTNGSISGNFIFNSSALDMENMQQIREHLLNILESIAATPDIRLKNIPIILEAEKKQIRQYNDTYFQGTFKASVPDVINHLAFRHPNREMLVFHDGEHLPQRMTYAEFDNLTSKIANHLRETQSLRKGDKVIVSIKRSINTFAYIFGAMKAGLIVIPIESKKSELFDHKAQNSNAKLAIVDSVTQKLFTELEHSPQTLNIESPQLTKRINDADDSYYSMSLQDHDPAYIMYSSGTSTGIPKKSLLSHGGFSNLLEALTTQGYDKHLSVICTAPADFDAFLFDFLVAWATSGSIHITKDELRTSPEAFTDIVKRESIHYAVVLPELMSTLPPDTPLRYIITMGAAPREEVCQAFATQNPELKIYNGWGLTEGGICQSLERMLSGQDAGLIGRPVSNMHMYIIDQHMNLCPPGVPGQIYLSGPGLALEYTDNPELTASKFFTARINPETMQLDSCNPNENGAERYFATGDIGYYKKARSGQLSVKCIGRSDRRIKFCGVSLDLDAIENTIAGFHLVESVAVKPDDPKNITALHGFVVPSPEARSKFRGREKELKRELRHLFKQTKLPALACPQFIPIGKMPLTKNGKKAYQQLHKPRDIASLKQPRHSNHDLLRILKTMWKDIIGCNKLEDIDDLSTWEELGGHSLGLATLEQKINAELRLPKRINFTYFSTKMTVTNLHETLKSLFNSGTNTQHARRHSMALISTTSAPLFLNNTQAQDEKDKDANSEREQLRKSMN